ncbi:hypothetical protein B0H12DRAFT_1098573 [Mycena haematopus]|nr:hypothetical protein B0H12DRAFT_1098573 [Mycena haematopus]
MTSISIAKALFMLEEGEWFNRGRKYEARAKDHGGPDDVFRYVRVRTGSDRLPTDRPLLGVTHARLRLDHLLQLAATDLQKNDMSTSYPGNCHCGAFKFIVKLPDLNHVLSCDCRLCSRNAYLRAHPASTSDFVVVQEGPLKEYRHGTTTHKFCPTCGTSVISCNSSDGEIISVNVRALADIDPDSLSTKLTPCGVVDTSSNSVTPSSQDDLPASCHCGAISYTLHSTPAATKSCNCSICSRDGVLWIYPLTTDVTVHAQESLVEYTFGNKLVMHGFCGICSVHVWEKFLKPEKAHTMGLNVRAINVNGFNFEELPTKVHNGKASMPPYQI